MKIFSVISVTLFCCAQNFIVAQSSNVEESFRCPNYASQYQIEVVNSRNSLNLPITICDIISENQHNSEIVTVSYSEEVRLKIYPKNYNLDSPIKEVVYVSE